MKKNKMIAALAVTAMVMCAVAPANVVYATEVNTQETADKITLDGAQALLPSSIKLNITEREIYSYTPMSGGEEHPVQALLVEELNKYLTDTGYAVTYISVSEGINYGELCDIYSTDIGSYRYTIEDMSVQESDDNYGPNSSYKTGNITVEYTNKNIVANAQEKYEQASKIFEQNGYTTTLSNFNQNMMGNPEYFNKYITDSDVRVEYRMYMPFAEDHSGGNYKNWGHTFFFVGDEFMGANVTEIRMTEGDTVVTTQTITDGITFVGGIGAKISAAVLDTKSEEYTMMTEAVQAMGYDEIFSAHEFTLEEGDISGGITITFNVGTKNNGREAIVLHQLQNGEFEEFKTIVKNGVITAEVTELSPFVVALGDVVEGDIVDGLDDEPQTGEGNFGFLFYTACLALGAVLLVKRKEA